MTMFILGVLLLIVGLGTRFWELVGWAPHLEETESRATLRSWTKIVASLVGLIFFVYGFPMGPLPMSSPGWVAAGIVFLVPGLFDFPWQQEMFKTLMNDDEDYKFGYGVVRTIAVIIAAICIGIGVGDGDPTDNSKRTDQVQQTQQK